MLPVDYGYLHNSIYIVNWVSIRVFRAGFRSVSAGIARFREKDPPLFGIQSVNSQAIVTKFCNHYYLIIWQQP